MTSSARARRGCGTARPSAFAVLRLITSSNFVGPWTECMVLFGKFLSRKVNKQGDLPGGGGSGRRFEMSAFQTRRRLLTTLVGQARYRPRARLTLFERAETRIKSLSAAEIR